MIAQFLGLKAAGVYSTVVFLTNALQVPFRSIFRVSSPLVADHWKNRDFDKMHLLYQNVSSVSIFIGLLLFLPIWNNIDLLFSFLKPEFQDGIWVFFWLMLGKLIDMYFGINGSIFSTSKKFKYDIYFTLFLIGSVYVLNLFFIPKWGIVGAALSTTFALVFYNFGRMIFVWIIFKMHPFKLNQFKIIALAIFTLISAYFMAQLKVDKWLLMGIQLLNILTCFLLPIYLFNLENESIQFIKKRISKFKKSNS
jgi:O-antigen/teichoic acid export membrane protein